MGRALSRWRSATAVIVGRSHERAGLPCQDRTAGRQSRGVNAIALADGAGSASCSGLGADVAIETTLDRLTDMFDELVADESGEARRRFFQSVLSRLESAAAAAATDLRTLACTLLFVAVKDRKFIAGHVGDGMIVRARALGCDVLSQPQRGEFANETVFITSRDAWTQFRWYRGTVDDITAFALMSDGSAASLYSRDRGTVASAVTTVLGWLDEHPVSKVSQSLVDNLRDLLRDRTGDDCSLAMLRRVTLDSEQVADRSAAFLMDFLDCRSPLGLKNRLAVLKVLEEEGVSSSSVSKRVDLSERTVRRHRQFLEQLW